MRTYRRLPTVVVVDFGRTIYINNHRSTREGGEQATQETKTYYGAYKNDQQQAHRHKYRVNIHTPYEGERAHDRGQKATGSHHVECASIAVVVPRYIVRCLSLVR